MEIKEWLGENNTLGYDIFTKKYLFLLYVSAITILSSYTLLNNFLFSFSVLFFIIK